MRVVETRMRPPASKVAPPAPPSLKCRATLVARSTSAARLPFSRTIARAPPRSTAIAALEALERVLADEDGGGADDRDEITVRLQTLLSRWLETGAKPGDEAPEDPADSLAFASTDELLDLIDNEFGRAQH